MGDEIKTIFSGQTHRGSYNFNSQGVARNGYTESHSPDGRVFYDEGELKAHGSWYVANDSLCFLYENENMNGGCFRVYRIQNCFYYYSNRLAAKAATVRGLWKETLSNTRFTIGPFVLYNTARSKP